MRQITAESLLALRGSRAGDRVIAYARYGSSAIPDPLPLASYSFNWDTTRQVQSFACTVADSTGELAPWLLEDPLGVGGAVLDVRYEVGGTREHVNMGTYRISQNKPTDRWLTYIVDELGRVNRDSPLGRNKAIKYASGGSSIEITAYDPGGDAKRNRLVAPESPPSGATVVSEVTRLMADHCGVVLAAGVVDEPVSANLIHERERLDAVQDLCKRLFCDYRFTGEGLLEIYPITEQASVATLQGGPEGLLVRVDRAQDIEGLYNRFVVDGTKDVGNNKTEPVRAIVDITTGPLSVYGPHGVVPEFYSSPMITSQAQADAYASKMALQQMSGLTTDLAVTALPMPHLQQGDWVTVASPVVRGEPVPLLGRVKAMTLKSGGGLAPAPMELIVECRYWDVAAVIGNRRLRGF